MAGSKTEKAIAVKKCVASGMPRRQAVKLIEELAKRLDKLRATKGLPPYTEKDYLATLKD